MACAPRTLFRIAVAEYFFALPGVTHFCRERGPAPSVCHGSSPPAPEAVEHQLLMATGADFPRPPKRFPPAQTLE